MHKKREYDDTERKKTPPFPNNFMYSGFGPAILTVELRQVLLQRERRSHRQQGGSRTNLTPTTSRTSPSSCWMSLPWLKQAYSSQLHPHHLLPGRCRKAENCPSPCEYIETLRNKGTTHRCFIRAESLGSSHERGIGVSGTRCVNRAMKNIVNTHHQNLIM